MNKIKDIIFYMHLYIIHLLPKLRQFIGKINAKRIDTSKGCGVVKIHAWQFKLFKCITDEDFYIVTGIYDALIKPKICNGYRNFKFSNNTYQKIRHILRCNYKWNAETQWGNIRAIDFTWALGSTPMSVDGLDDWVVVWNKNDML